MTEKEPEKKRKSNQTKTRKRRINYKYNEANLKLLKEYEENLKLLEEKEKKRKNQLRQSEYNAQYDRGLKALSDKDNLKPYHVKIRSLNEILLFQKQARDIIEEISNAFMQNYNVAPGILYKILSTLSEDHLDFRRSKTNMYNKQLKLNYNFNSFFIFLKYALAFGYKVEINLTANDKDVSRETSS